MSAKQKTFFQEKLIELTELSASDSNKLFEIAVQKNLKKGEVILMQGQVCKTIFFVEKGYLRTFLNKDGIEINTDFTFEGSFTTNLKSLRSASASDTTVLAGEASTVYEFDKEKLLNLYTESKGIETFGRNIIEELLVAQEEHSNLFKIYSPTERYHYLQTSKPELLQRISLSQLASYLGIARETLSRIRKK